MKYYLINNKIMKSSSEMPKNPNHKYHDIIDINNFDKWLNSLQPCEISESELEKVVKFLYKDLTYDNTPIEITDIVEEKSININKEIIDLPESIIVFKQPKKVESDEFFTKDEMLSAIITTQVSGSIKNTQYRESLIKDILLQRKQSKQVESDGIEAINNWNDYITKKGFNNWQKVSNDNLPEKCTTNLIFFTRNGGIFCGHYKSNTKTFICYGINGKEILDVEVTHWKNELFPKEYQEYLDSLDKGNQDSYPSK